MVENKVGKGKTVHEGILLGDGALTVSVKRMEREHARARDGWWLSFVVRGIIRRMTVVPVPLSLACLMLGL